MSRCLLKFTHYSKIKEDLKLNDKRQSIDSNTEISEVLELSDKEFKAVVKMLQGAVMNMLETKK